MTVSSVIGPPGPRNRSWPDSTDPGEKRARVECELRDLLAAHLDHRNALEVSGVERRIRLDFHFAQLEWRQLRAQRQQRLPRLVAEMASRPGVEGDHGQAAASQARYSG